MATKGKESDEGGSGAERKGRVPTEEEEAHEAESPYGDIDLARDLEELEREGLYGRNRAASPEAAPDSDARRREAIGSNPDQEEELAEEALASSSEDEEEAPSPDRRRR
jgi:hypothetical protein